MNDFTKEDLEHIATIFKFTEVSYPDFELNEDLWVKIESMIDNYCEHKNARNGDPSREREDCGRQII